MTTHKIHPSAHRAAKVKALMLSIFAAAAILSSCYDDEGNYDYKELNEISVDTTLTGTSFSIDRYDTLRISPTLLFSQQPIADADLDFKWEMYLDDWADADGTATILSTEKNLCVQISRAESTKPYAVVLNVTNRQNGTTYRQKYHLSIQPSVLSGLLVLQDDGGRCRLDYLASTYAEPSFASTRRITDVYGSANDGAVLDGTPRGVEFTLAVKSSYEPQIKRIYVWTDSHVVQLDASDFTLQHSDYSLFLVRPDRLDITKIQRSSNSDSSTLMVNGGQLQALNQQASMSYGYQFTRPLAPNSTLPGEVRLSPYLYQPDLLASQTGFTAIGYDTAGRRFVKMDYSVIVDEVPLKAFDTQNEAALQYFDVNNIGKDIIWMGKGNAGQCFAVFTDGTNRQIYRCRFNIADILYDEENNAEINPQVYNVAMGVYDLSASEGGDDARFFDTGRYANTLLYATPRNIYTYDFSARRGTLINDAFPEGEQITAMKIYNVEHYTPNLTDVSGALLYVATWNGREGKVYEFPLNRTTCRLNNRQAESGNLKEPYNVFGGFGKVIDLCVKCQGRSD